MDTFRIYHWVNSVVLQAIRRSLFPILQLRNSSLRFGCRNPAKWSALGGHIAQEHNDIDHWVGIIIEVKQLAVAKWRRFRVERCARLGQADSRRQRAGQYRDRFHVAAYRDRR